MRLLRASNPLIIPWLGRQFLFQTFDEDPNIDLAEIQRLLEEDEPETPLC
jgi:hypothetical protein